MGIRMTTKLDEIHKVLMKEANRVERLTIRALSYLGEQCVSRVRDREGNKSWYDQSGNLRSSVGYVIAYNGNIIQYSDFNQIKQGSEGVSVGKNLAKELVKRYPNDYVLVIVAGTMLNMWKGRIIRTYLHQRNCGRWTKFPRCLRN